MICCQTTSLRCRGAYLRMDAATHERNQEMRARPQCLSFEDVRRSVAIIGTPEHWIERIQWLQPELYLNELICWFNSGGLMPLRHCEGSRGIREATLCARSKGDLSNGAPFHCHGAGKKLKSPRTAAEKHRTKNAHVPHKCDVNGTVWPRQNLPATSVPFTRRI
jgi:hypothetical protein